MPTKAASGSHVGGINAAIAHQSDAAFRAVDIFARLARERNERIADRARDAHTPERPLLASSVAELADTVYFLTGVRLSPVAVCAGHSAPLDAFAEAFFATHPLTIWKASRGLGGKSTMLALLAHLETIVLGAQVTILGGSGQQSKRVHAAQDLFWSHANAPTRLLARPPTQYETHLNNGGEIVALMASQASARGPHPQRLRLDEADEMSLDILDAALGQPMSARGIDSQVVASSTHQYADGTMTELLKRAADRGYPVRTWCWRENLEPHGWLSENVKERVRGTVTTAVWNIEHELGEPSPQARAIDTASVDRAFRADLGEYGGALDEDIIAQPPVEGAEYATGADWARDVDYSIIWTYRVDVVPFQCVAYKRTGRKPYPQMVEDFDARVRAYPGPAAYDGTGLGKVIDDLTTVEAQSVTLVGRTRSELLGDYVKAIENSEVVAPMIQHAYGEHKLATLRDLYGTGHLPDSVCGGAMALYAWRHRPPPAAGEQVDPGRNSYHAERRRRI